MKAVSHERMTRLLSKEEITLVQLCILSLQTELGHYSTLFSANVGKESTSMEWLDSLLSKYEDIFREPKGLPSRQEVDHMIPLKRDRVMVNQKPNRYSTPPKDVIERMIQKMLDSYIIQPSSSPFSSPVVLVKKKNHFWRMCVDYRRLNTLSIKDKFLIPLFDEFLDELHGASVVFEDRFEVGIPLSADVRR